METDCPLRILIVEDLPADAELAVRELRKDSILFTSMRVDTKEAFLRALEEFRPDLIISDYAMPEFDGMQALKLSLAHDPHLPFILFTGSMNEETAVACMKAGATDYVIKERITRLPLAVRGALEQRQALLDKAETANELIAIYENAPLIMMLMDGDRRIHKINGYAAGFSCRSSDAMFLMRCGEALRCLQALAAPEGCGFGPQCDECTIRCLVKETIETGRIHRHVEGKLAYPSEGRQVEMTYLLSTAKLNFRKQPLVLATLLDITDRKRAEESLRLSEENFHRSLDESPLGARIVSEAGETLYANRAILHIFGYESIEELRKTPVSKRYTESSYAAFQDRREKRRLHADDSSDYEIDIVRKDGTVRNLQVWRKEILWNGGKHYQVIYRDITDRKRMEGALLKTTERLRRSLAGTVQAISAAVEVKDPYTSGHQKRTADLARAIATEMGFNADRADFIRIATTIHDIGKISVPSEILSKPTKLREIEFGLIKVHPQAGYDILQDIEFPWPVAEVILQHHERMDGSGYPRHLKGDGILMEARIVSVADVVEAIASHRPYRAALGVEAAMEEISKNRNILYDPEVTDACLKLFHEKGYCFN
jgi:PAS domain S-box-containing protein